MKLLFAALIMSFLYSCSAYPQALIKDGNTNYNSQKEETASSLLSFEDERLDSLINDPLRDYSYWLNFGFGGSYYGTTMYTGVSYLKNNIWFSFRYYFAQEHQNEYDFENLKIPSKSCHELGLLTGIMFRNKNVAIGIAGGIAYLYAIDRGNYIEDVYHEEIKVSGISFPIETKFRLSINGIVGGGFSIISNINKHKTHFGAILELTFGLL